MPMVGAFPWLAFFLVASGLLAPPVFAKAEKTPAHVELDAETYTERGEMTGCGLSFVTLWQNDAKQVVGATGSLNFFFLSDKKNVASGFKLTTVINGQQVPVSFAWVNVEGYGKTTDFIPGKAELPGGFMSWKSADPRSSILPAMMSRSGFILGVSFPGLPLDELVQLPPAPDEVTQKISNCMDELQAHMRAVLKRG